ncbi:MAG: hypothetical protein J3Q66DRAFT_437124 [Benniella sp.]|nr:MAG: hypothetical protein J3Q66DRAFT_437124 [Benniella sp.]
MRFHFITLALVLFIGAATAQNNTYVRPFRVNRSGGDVHATGAIGTAVGAIKTIYQIYQFLKPYFKAPKPGIHVTLINHHCANVKVRLVQEGSDSSKDKTVLEQQIGILDGEMQTASFFWEPTAPVYVVVLDDGDPTGKKTPEMYRFHITSRESPIKDKTPKFQVFELTGTNVISHCANNKEWNELYDKCHPKCRTPPERIPGRPIPPQDPNCRARCDHEELQCTDDKYKKTIASASFNHCIGIPTPRPLSELGIKNGDTIALRNNWPAALNKGRGYLSLCNGCTKELSQLATHTGDSKNNKWSQFKIEFREKSGKDKGHGYQLITLRNMYGNNYLAVCQGCIAGVNVGTFTNDPKESFTQWWAAVVEKNGKKHLTLMSEFGPLVYQTGKLCESCFPGDLNAFTVSKDSGRSLEGYQMYSVEKIKCLRGRCVLIVSTGRNKDTAGASAGEDVAVLYGLHNDLRHTNTNHHDKFESAIIYPGARADYIERISYRDGISVVDGSLKVIGNDEVLEGFGFAMKIALTSLAAVILPNVALAQHYACMRLFGAHYGEVLHVAIFDHNKNIVMDETKSFVGVDHFTLKNSRGRFDWKRYSDNWSAAFDGRDWGTYSFQDTWTGTTSDYKIGCYDLSGTAYCLEPSVTEMKYKCLDKINDYTIKTIYQIYEFLKSYFKTPKPGITVTLINYHCASVKVKLVQEYPKDSSRDFTLTEQQIGILDGEMQTATFFWEPSAPVYVVVLDNSDPTGKKTPEMYRFHITSRVSPVKDTTQKLQVFERTGTGVISHCANKKQWNELYDKCHPKCRPPPERIPGRPIPPQASKCNAKCNHKRTIASANCNHCVGIPTPRPLSELGIKNGSIIAWRINWPAALNKGRGYLSLCNGCTKDVAQLVTHSGDSKNNKWSQFKIEFREKSGKDKGHGYQLITLKNVWGNNYLAVCQGCIAGINIGTFTNDPKESFTQWWAAVVEKNGKKYLTLMSEFGPLVYQTGTLCNSCFPTTMHSQSRRIPDQGEMKLLQIRTRMACSTPEEHPVSAGTVLSPRLFIQLPEDGLSWNPLEHFSDKSRLYVLCERVEHTDSISNVITHHMHLVKHDGVPVSSFSYLIRTDGADQAMKSLKAPSGILEPGASQVTDTSRGSLAGMESTLSMDLWERLETMKSKYRLIDPPSAFKVHRPLFSKMKIALTSLAAALILPSVALAEHYACMRFFTGRWGHVLNVAIFDHNKNIIMDETKNFLVGTNHFTIKNSRGRFDWGYDSHYWSALFDDVDWGKFSWQLDWGDSKIGCYDPQGAGGYCKEPSLTQLRDRCMDALYN